MRDNFFDIKRRDSEQLLTRCVDHVELSCQMCVMCPHDPIACRLSRFDVLLSVFFTRSLLLYFHVHFGGVAMPLWWKPSSVHKQLFLSCMNCVSFLLPLVWHARCATRGRIERHWG